MKFLITGSSGFIGYHLTKALLDEEHEVVGVDNHNDYYDENLKKARYANLLDHKASANFKFHKNDISKKDFVETLFNANDFDYVINLAAQAGVRYSIDNPYKYLDSNLVGFINILEGCRHSGLKHFIFASSSSVYGMNLKQPFSTDDRTDSPISLYAATKKSNELLAYSYSHLYGIPTTGLRFFTVYGPYGRPDMAYFKFTKSILEGKPIDVYNNGEMKRDFTYIDDIIRGIILSIENPPDHKRDKYSGAKLKYRILNIGNNNPISLDRFISAIEIACNQKATRNLLPMQPGDVPITFADIDDIKKDLGFDPSTKIEDGIINFVNWYKSYYEKNTP